MRRVVGSIFILFGGKLPDQVLVDVAEHVVGLRLGRYLRNEVDDVADRLVTAADVLAKLGEASVKRIKDAGMPVDFRVRSCLIGSGRSVRWPL